VAPFRFDGSAAIWMVVASRARVVAGHGCSRNEEARMPIPPEAANRSTTVDPEKWLGILQRWHPRMPREELVDFINDCVEAAGPQRVEGLDDLFVHVDKTTRSAQEKLDKLRQWNKKMRSDPRFWPQLFERNRPVLVLIKKIVDESPRPVTRRDVERKFRKYRKVPSTGLGQELKELANHGEIDRLKLGVYWRRGTASTAYESDFQRMYKLVYHAPNHRMREAELAVALGLSRGNAGSLVSILRKRGLFAPATGNGVVVASAESLATLQRGPIFEGRGGIFFSAPEIVARADAVTFTTLRPERPPVDLGKLAQEVGRLKGLKKRQQIVELDATVKALGVPRMQLELMVRPAPQVTKNAERNAIQEAAKEKWRADYRVLVKHPERLLVRKKLWEEARGIPGLTRQIFRDVISEEGPGKPGPRPGIRAKKLEKNGANSA
jgi:hypothetical protein